MEPEDKNGPDLLKNIIFSTAAVVLTSLGVWTGSTLNELSENVHNLQISIVKLEGKLNRLPPADLLLRVDLLERRLQRLEQGR